MPYKGEAVPLNKPLEFSCFNVMENKGSTSRQQRLSSTSRQQRLSSTSRQQRLSSTITASHRISETRSPAESEANSPYENHALTLWTERRRDWVGTRERPRPAEHREPLISWSTTYEDLLGTNRPFAKPIPLPEMVDFLVDVWEQEGLFE